MSTPTSVKSDARRVGASPLALCRGKEPDAGPHDLVFRDWREAVRVYKAEKQGTP